MTQELLESDLTKKKAKQQRTNVTMLSSLNIPSHIAQPLINKEKLYKRKYCHTGTELIMMMCILSRANDVADVLFRVKNFSNYCIHMQTEQLDWKILQSHCSLGKSSLPQCARANDQQYHVLGTVILSTLIS